MPLTQQPAAAKSYSLFAVASVIRWTHEFASSATVHRVLLWAIGKCVFNLDDTAKVKTNLLLPGTEQPLPTDSVIGSFVKHGDCQLMLELTLKDFTNG
jgi:hypothetical protein